MPRLARENEFGRAPRHSHTFRAHVSFDGAGGRKVDRMPKRNGCKGPLLVPQPPILLLHSSRNYRKFWRIHRFSSGFRAGSLLSTPPFPAISKKLFSCAAENEHVFRPLLFLLVAPFWCIISCLSFSLSMHITKEFYHSKLSLIYI